MINILIKFFFMSKINYLYAFKNIKNSVLKSDRIINISALYEFRSKNNWKGVFNISSRI
jgi:hypothetical protein